MLQKKSPVNYRGKNKQFAIQTIGMMPNEKKLQF